MAKRKAPLEGATGQPPGGALTGEKKITWLQDQFVEAYVDNKGNATEAYQRVYKCTRMTAAARASFLLTKDNIQAAIEARRQELRDALKFDRTQALSILVAMVTTTPDQLTAVMRTPYDRRKYTGLGAKKHAIQVEKTPDGYIAKTLSAGEKRAALNDLFEKLGLGKEGRSGNWFDGLEQLMQLVHGTKKPE